MVDKRLLALVVVAAAGALGFWLASTFTSSGEVDLERQFAGPKDPGTPVYHSLVGEAWRPIIGEENWQRNIVDDPKRTAVTDAAAFQEFVTEFQDFPLYWVSLEFQGLPLTRITRSYRPHLTPAEEHVILKYGTCTPRSEGGCSVPLQIRVEPYCYAQPGMYAPEAKEGGVFQVRGADGQYISGALRMWLGTVSVRVSAYPEELMEQAAEALVSPNGQGPTEPGQPFPPLDRDCSDFALEPYLGD